MVRATAGGGRRSANRSLAGLVVLGPGSIPAKAPNRRPIRHCRWRRGLVESREVASAIDHLAADYSQFGRDAGDLILGAGEVVAVGDDQVGELTDLDATLLTLLVREPGDVLGPHSECCLA